MSRRGIRFLTPEATTEVAIDEPEEEIREATSARCPECGLEVELGALIVGDGGGTRDNQERDG